MTYDAATRTVTLTPTSPLANLTLYTATVKSGASGVKDAAGNPLASDVVWTFTTVADTTAPTVSDGESVTHAHPTIMHPRPMHAAEVVSGSPGDG